MHDVMTIKERSENCLVCTTRLAERLAGAALFLLAGAVTFLAVLVNIWPLILGTGCLSFLGLYTMAASRHFAFTRNSQTCMVRIRLLGFIARKQEIDFGAVAICRQFDLQFLRWLYVVTLADRQQLSAKPFRMGYAISRSHAESLAATIARFTQTKAVRHDGIALGLC